jgi:vancomycin resistance protein YoaR
VDLGEDTVAFLPADIGFDYDEEATVDAAMDTRRTGGGLSQFWSWVTTPFAAAESPVAWSFDRQTARDRLAASLGLTPVPAVEPRFRTNQRGQFVTTPGVAGTTVDLDRLLDILDDVDLTDAPSQLQGALVEMPPTVSDEDAAQAVAMWSEMTNAGVRVSVNGRTVRLSPQHLRHRMILTAVDGRVDVEFDIAALQEGIEAQFPGPVAPPIKPVFEVANGEFSVVEKGRTPQVCCTGAAARSVAAAVLGGTTDPFGTVYLDARALDNPLQKAIANGSLIVEQVSSFTTEHVCCESRVTNIHRFADIVNGAYILPGETFSLNDFVGPRTLENGFVAAGAIRQGHLTEEIGGGVSQFATTFFNAAYFAGLDYEEYQSHSLYFSRYPYGREATISTPYPDLAVINTTAFPILIGTSYTDTSITVSMYSTKSVIVDELEQRSTRVNLCTHVETDRKRTYPDGTFVIDTIFANYRPADGIDCNGDPIPVEGDN